MSWPIVRIVGYDPTITTATLEDGSTIRGPQSCSEANAALRIPAGVIVPARIAQELLMACIPNGGCLEDVRAHAGDFGLEVDAFGTVRTRQDILFSGGSDTDCDVIIPDNRPGNCATGYMGGETFDPIAVFGADAVAPVDMRQFAFTPNYIADLETGAATLRSAHEDPLLAYAVRMGTPAGPDYLKAAAAAIDAIAGEGIAELLRKAEGSDMAAARQVRDRLAPGVRFCVVYEDSPAAGMAPGITVRSTTPDGRIDGRLSSPILSEAVLVCVAAIHANRRLASIEPAAA